MSPKITSDKFIELFITLKQLDYLQNTEETNLYNLKWSFDINLLNDFIFHSLKDYRYCDILSCFKFNGEYSIDLILALNRALAKHILTGIYDYEAYISKFYVNTRIVEDNKEFYNFMLDFIKNFDYFCLDKETYKKNSEIYLASDSTIVDNSRLIFDLRRKLNKFE